MSDYLRSIDGPPDLRELTEANLPELCAEIREFLIRSVFASGGHLSANLGSVELTVALHYVFDFLQDRLVWDVGHQAYTHKILTGRRDRFHTQRCTGGLSGFTNPLESAYDQFMGGHAGTSISTGLGLAAAAAMKGEKRKAVVVIGDASIGAGMALEGLNMAGCSGKDMLIVLNDNRMSISKTVGALSSYLTKLRTLPLYSAVKQDLQVALASLPLVGDRLQREVERVMDTVKYYLVPGHFFEELGLKYFGPYDGHDVEAMVRCLRDVKRHRGPAILHVLTEKGKGYGEAEADPIKFHGVSPVAPAAKEKVKSLENGLKEVNRPSWTQAFSDSLIRLAETDPRIVAITAAMGNRHRPLPASIPRSFHRRGHLRAACGGNGRRPGAGGTPAGRGDLLHLPPARLRPGLPRCGAERPAGDVLHGSRRNRRSGRLVASRRLRHRLPADLPAHRAPRSAR
jgi:1-deoxy-D-xylulose-5-phosphate synthase